MDNIDEYLQKTESASRMLFEAADSYRAILRAAPNPILVASVCDDGAHEQRVIADWVENNRDAIEEARVAQRTFVAESFALGVVCGSILQVAVMAIQLFSRNAAVPDAFHGLIGVGTKTARFCVGREVRGVPMGLVAYAGRNQYNHLDDNQLRDPNLTIFNRLALNWRGSRGEILDPAFDLQNEQLQNYAPNIVSLLGWEDYGQFQHELSDLLA